MARHLLLFLFSLNAVFSSAQTAEETLRFAREQIGIGNHALALKTYERVLFFTGDRYREECYGQLAALHALEGSAEKAAFYCDLLYQSASSDSLRYEALFQKVGLLMLQNHYKKALLELFALPKKLSEPWASRRCLYLGAAHFGARDFRAARADLLPLFAAEDVEGRQKFERLMRQAERVARKSPKTARWLSVVLPGAGQFYAGDVKNGLNSLLLNAALGYWFVSTGISYTYIDAAATVAPWLFRYYGGGFKRAGEILEKKKEERLRKIFRAVLRTAAHESCGKI
jgi:TM2 domain-containing membrane protein YozV